MATDVTISHYSVGTATVAANGTAVTGQGTAWADAIRTGDLFGTHRGLPIRILSINSNTSLTLAHPWPGPAQTAAAYEIQHTPRDMWYRRAIEELISDVSEGNLPLLAALLGAPNKLAYFDSSHSMALADFPAWARALFGLPGGADKLPYLSGVNGAELADFPGWARALFAETGQLPNARVRNDLTPDKAFRRGNILGAVSRSGGVPTGAIIERGENANGEYERDAGGRQVCRREFTLEASNAFDGIYQSAPESWNFPASFISRPSVSASSRTGAGAAVWGATTTVSSTGCGVQAIASRERGPYTYVFEASGRWF